MTVIVSQLFYLGTLDQKEVSSHLNLAYSVDDVMVRTLARKTG